jgi:hypothetical protein
LKKEILNIDIPGSPGMITAAAESRAFIPGTMSFII